MMLSLNKYLIGSLLGISSLAPTSVFAKSLPPARLISDLAQKKVVLDIEHQLLQARVSTDTSIHRASFADDGMYMHSSGRVQNKAEVLKMVAESPWVSWSKSDQEVGIYGNAAVTHSLLSVRLVDKRTETVRATGVYVNELGRWRQVSWQSSEGMFVGPAPSPGK